MPTENTSAMGGVDRRPLVRRLSSRRPRPGRVTTGAVALAAIAALLAACGDSGVFVATTSSSPSTVVPATELPPPPSAIATVAGTALPVSGGVTEGTVAGDAAATTGDAAGETAGATTGEGTETTAPAACDGYTRNETLPVQRCDSGPLVLAVQLALQSAGYEITALDGEFGDQTDAAVRAFQAAESLAVDGVVGNQTWGAIDFPANVATDANGDGVISPDEVTVG